MVGPSWSCNFSRFSQSRENFRFDEVPSVVNGRLSIFYDSISVNYESIMLINFEDFSLRRSFALRLFLKHTSAANKVLCLLNKSMLLGESRKVFCFHKVISVSFFSFLSWLYWEKFSVWRTRTRWIRNTSRLSTDFLVLQVLKASRVNSEQSMHLMRTLMVTTSQRSLSCACELFCCASSVDGIWDDEATVAIDMRHTCGTHAGNFKISLIELKLWSFETRASAFFG